MLPPLISWLSELGAPMSPRSDTSEVTAVTGSAPRGQPPLNVAQAAANEVKAFCSAAARIVACLSGVRDGSDGPSRTAAATRPGYRFA